MTKHFRSLSLGLAVVILFLSAIACAQAGRILTPAEATALAVPTTIPTAQTIEGFEVGSTVYLTGTGYIINFMDGPGSNHMVAGQERGVEVTILAAVDVEGVVWYQIKAPTGEGWVPEENLTLQQP